MALRATWKGFLRLSLVSVPVRAFTAHDTSAEIRLNQLHKTCHSRIRYQKVCPLHGEVKADEIVSGYEYEKDRYVVIEPDELRKIRKISDRSVQIRGFVPSDRIDPVYFAGRTCYFTPDGPAGTKPYLLLRQGMEQAGVFGLAHVVLSGREQLVVLRPHEGLLSMTVLHYARKVRKPREFLDELPREVIAPEELELASTLIRASLLEDLDLDELEDPYVQNLRKLIEMKVAGQEVVEAPEAEEPRIFNLMEALKKSVAAAQGEAALSNSGDEPARRKMAPSGHKKARKKKSG